MEKKLLFDGKTFLSSKPMPADLYRDAIIKGMTMANPMLPFLIYVPLVAVYSWLALAHFSIGGMAFAGLAIAGVLWWTVFEYLMHRYAFHYQPTSAWGKRLLYVMHHGHHQYPNDERLMVSNPWVSLPASLLFLGLGWLLIGSGTMAFMAGMLSAYLAYDWLHHAVHVHNFSHPLFQKLKKHHMRHHYRDPSANYGFVTTFWDKVMGTKD